MLHSQVPRSQVLQVFTMTVSNFLICVIVSVLLAYLTCCIVKQLATLINRHTVRQTLGSLITAVRTSCIQCGPVIVSGGCRYMQHTGRLIAIIACYYSTFMRWTG